MGYEFCGTHKVIKKEGKMKEKFGIRIVLAICVILFLINLHVADAFAKEFNWKFASYAHSGNKHVAIGQRWWCEEVGKRSQGQIKVKMYWAGELCGPTELMGAVKSRLADVVGHAPAYTPGETSSWSMTWLPFVCATRLDHNALINIRMHRESKHFIEEAKKHNCIFGGVHTARALDLIGKKAIRTVTDLKGVRIRAASVHVGEILKRFGAVPVFLPTVELFTSLERGLIDLTSFSYEVAHAYKLDEISKYLMLDMALADLPCMYLINKDSWNELPETLKKVIQSVIDDTPAWNWDFVHNPDFDKECWEVIKKMNIEVIHFPKSERDKIIAKAPDVWETWAKDSGDYKAAKVVLADYLRIRDEVVAKYPEGVPGIKYK
jgi:TRAP-type C4-dicarboxylate transport system substrate-binding protein